MTVSLTTNQSVYSAGQPIQMTFTETNTGTEPVRVQNGPKYRRLYRQPERYEGMAVERGE